MVVYSGGKGKVGMLYGVLLPKHKTVTPENKMPKLLKMRCSAESWCFCSGGKGKVA